MRTTIYKLIETLDDNISFPEPIHEFGAYQVAGQEGRAIRPLFSNRKYVGSDMRFGRGVDLRLDLHAVGLKNNSVGTAILLDTVEHVQYFWRASQEVYRVLKPGGMAIFTSAMYFPVHAYPSDYWRFTPEGFRVLGEPFDRTLIGSAGLEDFPHTVIAICLKHPIDITIEQSISNTLDMWKRQHSETWKEKLLSVLPPILAIPLYNALTNFLADRSKVK